MKWDLGKAFPYPVLRPHQGADGDYPKAEFEATIEARRAEGTLAVDLNVTFELSDPDLRRLVRQRNARCALVIESPLTRFRDLVQVEGYHRQESFSTGQLKGRVEIRPFLVCTRELRKFRANGWHADYGDRSFDIPVGAVLAQDEPSVYWIDTEDEKPIASIFRHTGSPDQKDGTWACLPADDQVEIRMSERDHRCFERTKHQREGDEAAWLINGVYLPALVYLLNEADSAADEYASFRWYATLDQKLEEKRRPGLGSAGAGNNRLTDAQDLLNAPLGRIPLFRVEESRASQ